MKKMKKGSNLLWLWPREEKDKFARYFYRDLSNLSKEKIHNKNKKLNLLQQIFRVFT